MPDKEAGDNDFSRQTRRRMERAEEEEAGRMQRGGRGVKKGEERLRDGEKKGREGDKVRRLERQRRNKTEFTTFTLRQ